MTATKLPDLGALLTIYDDAAIVAIGDSHGSGLRAVAAACYRAGQAEMRERACAVVYGQCESDNVAQRTADAIRALPIDGGDA